MGKASLIFFAFLTSFALTMDVRIPGVYPGHPWQSVHANFHGGTDASGGTCGHGNVYSEGYSSSTAALSTATFDFELRCGACVEIKCAKDPQWCHSGSLSIFVTATNFRYALAKDVSGQPPSAEAEIKTGTQTEITGVYPGDPWQSVHTPFHGGTDASGGACGHGNVYSQGDGASAAVLSTATFNFELRCGACVEINCAKDPQWCHSGSLSIFVTATNFRYPLTKDGSGQPPSAEADIKTGTQTQYWWGRSWSFTVTASDGEGRASTSCTIVHWQFSETFTARIFQV